MLQTAALPTELPTLVAGRGFAPLASGYESDMLTVYTSPHGKSPRVRTVPPGFRVLCASNNTWDYGQDSKTCTCTSRFQGGSGNYFPHILWSFLAGLEPPLHAYKASVLPINTKEAGCTLRIRTPHVLINSQVPPPRGSVYMVGAERIELPQPKATGLQPAGLTNVQHSVVAPPRLELGLYSF